MSEKLTPKQAIFIAEYLIDGNGTRAAIAASVPVASASVTASRWLKMPKVAAVIAERRARHDRGLYEAFDRACQRLARIALADVGKCYDKDNNRIPVAQLDDDTRAAVVAADDDVTETESGPGKKKKVSRRQFLKFADPIRATEVLGRRLGMFTDKTEHSGRVTLEQLICGGKVDDGSSGGGEQAA